ncbi:TolC family protein [Natronospora cellulosivora (SeqCode)]
MKKFFLCFILLLFFITFFKLEFVNAYVNNLYLEQAIETALRNNRSIHQGLYDRDKAEIDVEMARKAFYPEIDISTSYTRLFIEDEDIFDDYRGIEISLSDDFLGDIDLDIDIDLDYYLDEIADMIQPSKNNFQTSISIQQPVYLGGRLRTGLEQANQGLKASELQLEQTKNQLVLQVIQLYYNVLLAQERVELEKEFLDLVNQHKKTAQHSYEHGLTLKTDLLQVEIEQGRAVNSLDDAKNKLLIARRHFVNITGINLDGRNLEWPELNFNFVKDLESQFRLALENRIELELLDINRKVLENNLQMEKNSRLPNLILSGNYQWQGEEFSFDDGVGTITLAGNVSLFDKGFSSSRQKKVEKDIAQLELNRKDLEDYIKIEIEELLLKTRTTSNNISLEKLNVNRAKENLNIENRRYQEGMATNTEVLNAQTLLKQSKLAFLQAEFQYNINIFTLLDKTGLLLHYWQNNEGWNF